MARKFNEPKMERLINEQYHKLGLKFGYSDEVIKNIIESQYEFIRKTLINIPFRETHSEEEFNKLKTNFVLRYLGKIHTNWYLLNRVQEQTRLVDKQNKKRWEKR